jgi:hypothetical protein
MSMSISEIVYYPEVELVSYRLLNSGWGVTSSRLFVYLYGMSVEGVDRMILGSKVAAHSHAVRNVK